ncbi:STAS domain-containing protein [Saccharothrix sp. S26]|uniref:STAS domain-containing protein n=1 Tax=Saccharothrix sp. S26 TaxID=2907215 RepID=UPI001F2FA445|nr:STAS domain-containing protein [Saccharothrix sp. S26]MCE6995384.1 STAS domain-containing protein [Saccharothrix sp. S26]
MVLEEAIVDEDEPLSVDVRDRGDDTVLSVVGELDFGTTPRFLEVAEPVAALGEALVLDLSGLVFCDSSALSALVRLHKVSKAAGGTLCLAALQPQVKAAITMTSLHLMLSISDEVPRGAVGTADHA